MMGCSPDDPRGLLKRDTATGDHHARFRLGQAPVTQEAFQGVIWKQSKLFIGPRLPVETVSWDDAQAYLKAIGMRLPTEGEWENAAHAGSTAARYGDLDEIARYKGNSGVRLSSGRSENRAGSTCTTCWGTFGNGCRMGTARSITRNRPELIRRGRRAANIAFYGGSSGNKARNVRASLRDRVGPTVRLDTFGSRCAGELRPLQ